MKTRNWFWGIFFILSAVFVIASQTNAFVQIGVMSILATVLLAALLIQSLANLNFFGIFLSLAFLYVIYRKPLGLIEISLWLLITAALFAGMGFSFLFHKHPHGTAHWYHDKEQFHQTVETVDDNNPSAKVNFGATSKYLHADRLKNGQFVVSFGALELFFDQVQLDPEGAEIYLDCNLGAIKLYIPKHWSVTNKIHTGLGSVENDVRFATPPENAPTLTLTGNVQLGAVEIHYI
ncbi:LiaF transmembrane domain-containing protein [Marasmitruncus massiliensis]|jgi:hypothetical protein|uniref:LiaF transmembrane domain-containing protein n=1 Tax=Marasmitruncus massiliensis TaxID=1944642 RepID=UPI000C7C5D17|nr:hypothetical protein [Marasmitruncus massiliensis]MBE6905400.1 hypothetical protein [Oscillospiraceae bacterium]